VRARAIGYALFYALAPYRIYERRCHYAPMAYWEHCVLNLRLAGRWLFNRQEWGDVRFEVEVNGQRRRDQKRQPR
jgi:hypothetical protein